MFIIYDPKDRLSELAAQILQFTHKTDGAPPEGVDLINLHSFLTAGTVSATVCDSINPRSIYLTTFTSELHRKIREHNRSINGVYLRKTQAESTPMDGIAWIADIASLFKESMRSKVLTLNDGAVFTAKRVIHVKLNNADTLLVKVQLGVDLNEVEGVAIKPRIIPE